MLTLHVTEEGFFFQGRAMNITKQKNQLLEPYGKMVHNYGIVLQLDPSEEQAEKFRQAMGCARVVHNDYINCCKEHFAETGKYFGLSAYKSTRLPVLKQEKSFLKEVDKFALETAAENADAAYQNMFQKRAKYPKYASRRKPNGNRYTTKETNGNIAILFAEDRPCVKLPKVGIVPFMLPEGKSLSDVIPEGVRILRAAIAKDIDGFTVSLGVESIIDLVHPCTSMSEKDIWAGDAGLKEFLIYGNHAETFHAPNERYIRIHEKKLRRYQQKLSRRQYDKDSHTGSKNWEKARQMVAKEHRKIKNQRKDFHHKLSREIADRCTVFIREDLNVKGMMKNHHLAKQIASVGWYQFFTFLKYKLEAKGGKLISVNRFFPSSQTCSCCGYKNQEVKDLNVRQWVCPKCGTHHDRDVNAKENLLKEGIRILKEEGISITPSSRTIQAAC